MSAKKGEQNKTEGETSSKADERISMPIRKCRLSSASSTSSTAGSSPPDGSSFSRQQRNLAEKQRRDKLNSYISELAALVPMIAQSTKKLDKTSILRLSAAHLRLYCSSLNPKNHKKTMSWRPNALEAEHLNELLKVIDGFLVVTTSSAKIIFASRFVENYLGHHDIEMMGHSLFYFIHPDDHGYVRGELKKLTALSPQQKNGNSVRCTFCTRMRERSQPRSEVLNYQLMRLNCCYSVDEETTRASPKRIFNSRQSKQAGNDLAKGMLKLYIQPININPFDELSIAEAFQEEYVTRHGPSGEILFADHRISTITGHLPHEVIGMLAYDYIFKDDVPVAQFAQKLMFSSSDGKGMIVYRLRSRDACAVYLKTFGQLQFDKSSTKVSHFICVNKLLSEEEGKEELKKFNDRYSPRINEFFATSTNHPRTLKSVDRCQMVENGSSHSEEKTDISKNGRVSANDANHYPVPRESSVLSMAQRNVIQSNLHIQAPTYNVSNVKLLEGPTVSQRLCRSSTMAWREEIVSPNVLHPDTVYETFDESVVRLNSDTDDFEQLSSPGSADQECIFYETSSGRRKRALDMMANGITELSMESTVQSKHLKYSNGEARTKEPGSNLPSVANGISRQVQYSPCDPNYYSEWSSHLCDSPQQHPKKSIGNDINSLPQNAYSPDIGNGWDTCNSNTPCSKNMWSDDGSSNFSEGRVDGHVSLSTEAEDRGLEGSLRGFDQRNIRVTPTSSFYT